MAPTKLHIELTTNCNLSCPLCDHGKTDSHEIDFDILSKWLNQELSKITDITLCGSFGEPTLYSRFSDLIELIKTKNPKTAISINTNGSTKTFESWAKDLKNLDESDSLVFAIDGLEDTHKKYRISDFKKVFEVMCQIKRDFPVKVLWQMVLFEHNEHQVKEVQRICSILGITVILKFPHAVNENIRYPKEYLGTSWEKMSGENLLPCEEYIYISSLGNIEPCAKLRTYKEYKKSEIKNVPANFLIQTYKNPLNLEKNYEEICKSQLYLWLKENRHSINNCKKCVSCGGIK